MGTRNGLVGSERDVGLGFGAQTQPNNQSFPRNKMMMAMHHDLCHEALLSNGGFRGVYGDCGPMYCNTSNQVAFMTDPYDVLGSGATGAVVPKASHPSNTVSFAFNSSGGGMVASVNVRVPFTAAQWQELEKQTMIYKYMMASIPIPPHLLIPINKTPSNVTHPHSNLVKGGSLELGFLNNSDPEAWRCKRTDGKKWRCSRYVARDQKYCEKHARKTRPRSRKPVELQAHFANNNDNTTEPYHHQKPHFFNWTDNHNSSPRTTISVTSREQPRFLEWFMKGESVPVAGSNQEWQQMIKEGLNRDSTNFVTHLGDGRGMQNQRLNNKYSLLFSPELTTLEGDLNLNHTQETRHFIDNMIEVGNKCSSSKDEKLPHYSSLALSMSGGNEIIEEMGLGTMDSEQESVGDLKSQWMNSLSWMSRSPPGGPLAEALCLGIASSAKVTSPLDSPK